MGGLLTGGTQREIQLESQEAKDRRQRTVDCRLGSHLRGNDKRMEFLWLGLFN